MIVVDCACVDRLTFVGGRSVYFYVRYLVVNVWERYNNSKSLGL